MSNLTLTPGQIVKVRSRQYLVENVTVIPEQQTRIENSYEVKAVRVEPVGIVYLWPVSR